jgi:branched-chain amino acid transport system ATP-binding protein
MTTDSFDARPSPPHRGGEGPPAVLEVDRVVRRFGGLVAVDGVSLTLGHGERLAVIGPNGAGKTTLFKLIAGEVPTDDGQIRFHGQDITRWSARRRARLGIARTFQVSNLFGSLTVLENVRLAALARRPARWQFWPQLGRRDTDARDRADAVIDDLLLGQRATSRVAELSHGERRQVEIAMALVAEPRLLLLDEPAAGLSLAERARLWDILNTLPRSIPFLLIEHDLSFALGLADRVLCLDNGRPIALGTPAEVRRDPHVREVYLGRAAA